MKDKSHHVYDAAFITIIMCTSIHRAWHKECNGNV